MEVTRIFDLLANYIEKYGWKEDALAGKINGEWVKYSAKEYIETANNLSYGFLALNVKKGDKIAIISSNRPEWNFIDMALLQVGAIPVPIYPTISESDYKYILNHAEVKYVFVEGNELIRKIDHILPEVPSLIGIYTFKDEVEHKHFEELVELGKENQNPKLLEEIKSTIYNGDIATIIYTSGTTGYPKGVVLSHNNIISNFLASRPVLPFGSEGKALSYLPLCHVYERMLNYLFQYSGVSVYYAEGIGTISDDIKDVKPDVLGTVPRLLEKVFDKIVNTGRKLPWMKRQIFNYSLWVGFRYKLNNDFHLLYKLQLMLVDKLVYSKWREAMGGNFKVIASGGAALQPRLAKIFTAAGIPILEGYGLTETSPVIAVGSFFKNGRKFGTVGQVIPGVEVKIASDGEILCKGPNLMLGYYKEPQLTKDAIDEDGWFHTGDLGNFEPEGQLKITGRKKSIFKTSFGKYINPTHIEELFKESHFIEYIIVVGENQKFAGALIVPDFVFLKSWCSAKGIAYTTNAEMVQNPVIKKRFHKEVDKLNACLGETEQVKKYTLMEAEWSVMSGEITPTLKLKRNAIAKKYADVIEKIFS